LSFCLIDLKKEKKKEKKDGGIDGLLALEKRKGIGAISPSNENLLKNFIFYFLFFLFLTPAVAMNASATDFL